MKKIFVILIMVLSVVSINAQIATIVSNKDVFTVVDKWSVPFTAGVVPSCNVIRMHDGVYIMRFDASNQFEDSYCMFQLGATKDAAISTLKSLIEIFNKVKKENPATVTDVTGNSITIYKVYPVYAIDQKGVAQGSNGYSSNWVSTKILEKAIKSIANFKE